MDQAEGIPFRTLAVTERPQERLHRLGPNALSDGELLALLLRSGTRGHDVLSVSTRILAECGNLHRLLSWSVADFQRHKGVGRVKATQLVAVVELARRMIEQGAGDAPLLGSADQVALYFQPIVAGLLVEKFWLLCLNRKNRLLKRTEITSGTASSSLVHPREVFREAIRESALAVICVHNHPSGDPAPSAADIQVTRQLREAAKTVGIDLLDHVIVGTKTTDPLGVGHYSFRQAGLL